MNAALRRVAIARLAIAAAGIALAGAAAWPAHAFAPEPDVLDADDPTVVDDFAKGGFDLISEAPSDEDLVLAAQKVRTTVQEAPSIIYVVTRRQIAERGYRTINEVLRTVPGFEGDRWEGNGWQQESFSRGIPRGALILWNGVNINEPLRNFVSLDRKFPLEMVDRIEVTSGPGGVLWGSNALLGIVNIVTRRPDDTGLRASIGAGDGPGERLSLKGVLGISQRFGEAVGLYSDVSFFTTDGPELLLDAQKIVGSLPEPAQDSATFYLPESLRVSAGQRSWFFNWSGRLELGPLALDWMIPFETDYRAQATGGASLVTNYLTGEETGTASRSEDSIRVVSLSYRDRFDDDRIGIAARAYAVQWEVDDQPFGVFPSSPILLASRGQTQDLRLALIGDLIMRPGVAVDVDLRLGEKVTLVTGGEVFIDINRGVEQLSWVTDDQGQCPPGFDYRPFDPHLPCRIADKLIDDVTRTIGGGFVNADWRLHPQLVLSAGLRVQASSQFDPALLWSGGAVWSPDGDTHLKLFAASGLRPPGTASTNVRDTTSAISFKANPDLNAETSRSFELELNTMVLRDQGAIRDLYLRANGSFTLMDNVIGRPGGRFQNSETQRLVGAEAFARLRLQGGHELWANYTFTKVFDDSVDGGELRNFAAHIVNAGGKLSFLDDRIELSGLVTFKSEMSDLNRPPVVDLGRGDYSRSCSQVLAAGLSADDPLRVICSFPSMRGGVWVLPGFAVSETIKPVALLDLGVRFKNIWRDLSVSVFFHNVLDFNYYEPDFFNDARVLSRPQPKPGMSFFGSISLGI